MHQPSEPGPRKLRLGENPVRALHRNRRGTTTIEMAFVLPVFLAFVFGLIEYGRLQLTANLLKNAARQAARYGSTEGVSTSEAEARFNEIVASAVDVSVIDLIVKDASAFDTGGSLPTSESEYQSLPDIELSTADPRQLFVIRATVDYDDIAWVPLNFSGDIVLSGQAYMRHE